MKTKPNVFVHTVKSRRADHGALSKLSSREVDKILQKAEEHFDFDTALHTQIAKHAIITNPLSTKRESDTFPSIIVHANNERHQQHCSHCEQEAEEIRQCIDDVRNSDYAVLALPSLGGELMSVIIQTCSTQNIPLLLLTPHHVEGYAPRLIESMDFACFNAGYTSFSDMRNIIDTMFYGKLFEAARQRVNVS